LSFCHWFVIAFCRNRLAADPATRAWTCLGYEITFADIAAFLSPPPCGCTVTLAHAA
jgi:hypothetical protein